MYSLLPAMKGVTADMLIQTLSDMKAHYSEEKMRHQLDRFWKMLCKSITISKEDKLQVEEVLKLQYDWFIDTDPEVIERVEQAEMRGETRGEVRGKAQGKVEGRVEGELQALRQVVLNTVQDRFPDLIDLAQLEVLKIKQPGPLHKLIRDLYHISDELAAIRAFNAAKQGE